MAGVVDGLGAESDPERRQGEREDRAPPARSRGIPGGEGERRQRDEAADEVVSGTGPRRGCRNESSAMWSAITAIAKRAMSIVAAFSLVRRRSSVPAPQPGP